MKATLGVACAVIGAAGIFLACSSDDPAPAGPASGGDDGGAPKNEGGANDAGAKSAWPLLVPLQGCAPAFLAPIEVGGQKFQAFIDTGSASLGLAESSCAACADAGAKALYSPGASATDTGEDAHADYGDGIHNASWDGRIYSDAMKIAGTPNTAPLKFVAIEDQVNFFTAERSSCNEPLGDGIMGLGPAAGATNGTEAVIDKLIGAGMPASLSVRLCDHSGQLWLGGFDRSQAAADPVFTPLLPTTGKIIWYAIDLSDLQVNGKSLAPASSLGTAIIDTGASHIDLPEDAYKALVSTVTASQAYKDLFAGSEFFDPGTGFGTCLAFEDAEAAKLDTLPPVTLKLGKDGTAVEVPATSFYVIPVTKGDTRFYCPGVTNGGPPGFGGLGLNAILGYPLFRSQIAILDLDKQRAGFAPAKPNASCR